MESREFYRNKTEIGWALGPEKDWSRLGCYSMPTSSLALGSLYSISQLPRARAHGGSCLRLWLQLLPCPKRCMGLTSRGWGGQARKSKKSPYPFSFYR